MAAKRERERRTRTRTRERKAVSQGFEKITSVICGKQVIRCSFTEAVTYVMQVIDNAKIATLSSAFS